MVLPKELSEFESYVNGGNIALASQCKMKWSIPCPQQKIV